MTTSNKNFKVKNGLEVLGTSATVNGNEVLTVASSIAALADVDLTGAVEGNSLVFDASLNLIPGEGTGGGVAKYYVSDTPPPNPEEGIVWYHSVTGESFIYIVDEDSSQFVEVGTFGPQGEKGAKGDPGQDGADSTVPGPQGEQGESGIVAQPEPPEDTTVLWYDTDAPGYGIPLGGTAGQVLAKIDSEAFNTEWISTYNQSDADSDLNSLKSEIVGDAPTSLNTLGKIADAINDDPNFLETIDHSLELKADAIHTHPISSIVNLQVELDDKAEIIHDHNNLYYPKGYIDSELADKADINHNHDGRYYTETETDTLVANSISTAISNLVDSSPEALDTLNELAAALNDDANFAGTVTTALAGKSDIGHTHDDRYYTEAQMDTLLSYKSDTTHLHDDRYYTETESDNLLALKSPIASPTFTGTVAAPIINATTSISTVAMTITGTTNAAAINSGAITATGNVIPQATNTYDLGTSSLRWRNIFTQDLHLSNGIGDYTIIEGEENLYLVNNKSNKHFKFALIEVDPQEVPAKSEQ